MGGSRVVSWWKVDVEQYIAFGHTASMKIDSQDAPNTPALDRSRGWAKCRAVFLATLLFFAAAYFGSSRDFGAFLLQFLALPSLFLAVVAAILLSKPSYSHQFIAWALIGLAPFAYHFCSYQLVQQVRFCLWAPAHELLLAEASKRDGIIMGWDSWGMAGEDTFSYLVVDTQDRLTSTSRIMQWTKQVGQTCGIWEKSRVRAKLYLMTTYTDCPYDGIAPAD